MYENLCIVLEVLKMRRPSLMLLNTLVIPEGKMEDGKVKLGDVKAIWIFHYMN